MVSFSDAHSPHNLGREATVLEVSELSYNSIKKAIKNSSHRLSENQGLGASHSSFENQRESANQILFTIEFFPQEGKYHWDGHRKCSYSCPPETARMQGNKCPKCGSKLTIGVQHRMEYLADRKEPENVPKFYYHIPLIEILSRSLGRKPTDPLTQTIYHRFVSAAGNEFRLLYVLPQAELEKIVSERVLEAIMKLRTGKVEVIPGYDGVYGDVKLWDEQERKQMELSL